MPDRKALKFLAAPVFCIANVFETYWILAAVFEVLMRILAALFLTLGLGLSPCSAETWQAVKTDGLGFSIEMPGDPKVEEQDVDLDDGAKAKMRTIQILSVDTIYDVTVADYPKGTVQSIGDDKVLDNARDGALSESGETLVRETRIEFAGRPARELLITMPMGMSLRSRIFVVGDRLFNVGAITKKGNETSANIEKYFASFKLDGFAAAAKP